MLKGKQRKKEKKNKTFKTENRKQTGKISECALCVSEGMHIMNRFLCSTTFHLNYIHVDA